MRPDSTIQWTSYPALLVASAFAAGVVAETSLAAGVVAWMGLGGGGLLAWAAGDVWDRRRIVTLAPLLRIAALGLLAAAAGGARQAAYVASSPQDLRLVATLSPTEDENRLENVSLAGVVLDPPSESAGTWRFTVEVDSLKRNHSALGGASAAWMGVDGRVRATLHNPLWISTIAYPAIRQGDAVRLTGSLSLARGPRNPGAFDYAAYLARRGVCCTLYVNDDSRVAVTGSRRGAIGEFVVEGRRYVRRQLDRHVGSDASRAVLRALLLGDRGGVSGEEREQFASTGLMHLLAVSGLHVLLVGMVLYGLLRPVLMRARLGWKLLEITRAALTIGVLGFYLLLTGARPSVVRAVVMAVVVIGGLLAQRSSHALNSLGVAGVVLLAIRPPAVFDAGFQLSMAAVAGIVALNPRMEPWLAACLPERWREHTAGEWLVSMVSVSAAATLGTTPVLLFHFGQVAVGGLVLNVVAIPLTAIGLTAGILCVAVGGGVPFLGAAFGASADLFVWGLLETARWGADWLGWSVVSASSPGLVALAAVTSALVAGAQWPRPRARWGMAGVAAALLCASAWGPVVRSPSPVLDVVFLDVGQGDAALITTPSGRRVLVDAGPRTRYSDAGARILLPYFESQGISRLDAVVITHPDSDHLGGLPSILRAMRVGRVLHSGQPSDTYLYKESRRLLDSLEISNRALRSGDTLFVDPSVAIQVLGPPSVKDRGLGDNDASVVLRVVYGETSFLLTGDVERKGEQWLVERYGRGLSSHVVKVAHHGSSTSSSPAFVRNAVRQDGSTHAVVSVGDRNAFGLPDNRVLSRWQSFESHLHLTPRRGAVWMRSDGRRVWRMRW